MTSPLDDVTEEAFHKATKEVIALVDALFLLGEKFRLATERITELEEELRMVDPWRLAA